MIFSKSRLCHAISLSLATLLLASCGGGDDSSSSSTPSAKPVAPELPPTTDVQFTLEPTANIPKLNNTKPATFEHSQMGAWALQEGVYQPKLITLFNDDNNCPSFGSVACPSFERVWIDSSNRVRNDSWAYLPTDKTWVRLSDFQNVLKFSFGDFASDGTRFSSDNFDPQQVTWSESASGYQATFLDNANFKLSVTDKDISGSAIDSAATQTNYSNGAKSLNIEVGLESGEYYYFEDADNNGSSNSSKDDSVYKDLESYRAAHSNKQTVTCAFEEDSDLGLVFNKPKLGATLYALDNGSCRNSINESKPSKSIAEYVKVIDNKKVLVLPALSFDSIVDKPFYNVITLNDNSVAAHGRYYQKGYAVRKTDYINDAAYLDWLKTYNNETSALVLPPKTVG